MSEVHLFLLWSNARQCEDEIVADIAAHFRVLDLVEVEWDRETFARNLTCFYGANLPPGSDKETHSGTGPFLVCVVEDAKPRYRWRRAGRRFIRENRRMMDARAKYREVTGGGYRVHASADRAEAARDLVLLFGRRPDDFRGSRAPETPRRHTTGMLGDHDWAGVDELMLALEVTSGVRRATPRAGVDHAFRVDDLWWAVHVLNGEEVGPGVWRTTIAGQPATVSLRSGRARTSSTDS
jgi:hypothetical protein